MSLTWAGDSGHNACKVKSVVERHDAFKVLADRDKTVTIPMTGA